MYAGLAFSALIQAFLVQAVLFGVNMSALVVWV